MRKQLLVLGVLLILTGASVSALYVYQEDVRSDAEVLYGSVYVSDYDAMVRMGDTNYWNVSVDSYFSVNGVYEGCSLCDIRLEVTINENYVYESFWLDFNYLSDKDSLVPEDASPDQDSGPGVSRAYTDPLTGTTLLFRESNGILQSVRFTGTTVVGDEGGFQYAVFDLVMEYDPDITYVNSIETSEPGRDVTLELTGTENGATLSGAVYVDPVFRMVSPRDSCYAIVSASIQDTRIPAELLSYMTAVEDGTVYRNDLFISYLRQDGAYVVPDIQYRFGTDESGDMVFTMEGTVTVYGLDEICNVISQETVEFSYGVVG